MGCQERPGEARRSQEVPEGLQDDSNPPLDLKHQKPAEKACVPYAPLTLMVRVWPDIVRIAEILQDACEFDPNDTVRRHQELPGDARRGQERPGEARRYQKGSRMIQIHPWISNIQNLQKKVVHPMPPVRLYNFDDPTLLEFMKYCKKLANWTQTTVRRH